MQPQQDAPDSTQQTVFEDRISRRVHDRIVVMPGVSDRNDGAYRIGRLDHPGVSDRGLATSVQRRWLRAGATAGSQDSPMPYVHAQRKGVGMDAAAPMEDTPPLPHGSSAVQRTVAGLDAPGAQTPATSPAIGASGVTHGSAAGPQAGAVVAGAGGETPAQLASAAERTLPIVHAQRRVTATAPIVDAHTVNPVTQWQTPAQASVASTPRNETGSPASVQRFPSDPLSAERSPRTALHTTSAETQRFPSDPLPSGAGSLVTPSSARTENPAQPQIVQDGSRPTLARRPQPGVISETPSVSSNTISGSRAAGVTRAVEQTATQTAVTWGAPIVQRRVTRQRDTLALQDAARSIGGASPAAFEPSPLHLARTGSEGAYGIDSGKHPVVSAASSEAPSVTVQRRASTPVMAAPLHTRHVQRTAPGVSEMSHVQSERMASTVARVAASEALRSQAGSSVHDANPALALRAAAGLSNSSEAATHVDAAVASTQVASGDESGVSVHSTQRSSADEAGSLSTAVQTAPAVVIAQPFVPGSTSELVLRTKSGDADASPVVLSDEPSPVSIQGSGIGAVAGDVTGPGSQPLIQKAVAAPAGTNTMPIATARSGSGVRDVARLAGTPLVAPARGNGSARDLMRAKSPPTHIGGDGLEVHPKPAPVVFVKTPMPEGSIRRAVAPGAPHPAAPGVASKSASRTAGPARKLATTPTPVDHAARSVSAALMQRSALRDASSHGEQPTAMSPAGAEVSAGRPLVHASARRVAQSLAPALAGQPISAGLSHDGVARTAAFGADSTATLVMRHADQAVGREANSGGGGDATAMFAHKATHQSSPVVQAVGPVRAGKHDPHWVAASRGASTGATQLVTVVQTSPSNTTPTSGVGSVLPLHQGNAALASSAGAILAVSGGAEHLSLAHDVGAPSRTPWAQRVMTPNAARVQRAPPAPASTPAGASTSVSSTGSQASPAAQTSAQSMTPESIDLERVASAVYRIIRDRLIVERESKGL